MEFQLFLIWIKVNMFICKENYLHLSYDIFFFLACNTFMDCTSCLANRGKRYNCTWCDDIQKCSDGYDRSRHQWIRAQCHRTALEDSCPNSMEDIYDNQHFFTSSSSSLPSKSSMERRKQSSISSSSPRENSTFQTFRTILITLLLSVLILSLITLTVTYIYAYRNPTSPVGMWLLEHRPSTYIARFKRFNGSN